ncbi:MAG: L-aspartate oxidase [Kiritimatiellia bacterium]
MKTVDCDVLIIGSGLAGLMAAWHLRDAGNIAVVCKRNPLESNSNRAQGGVACAIDPDDSVEEHVRDTLGTGGGLSRETSVCEILSAGKDGILELEKVGVRFSRRNGAATDYDLGQEGGHSHRRVLHAGDITGHEIIKALAERVARQPNITIYPEMMAIDLVSTAWLKRRGANRCVGAYFLDCATEQILAFRSPHTILATGGAGKVYLYTTNSDVATGDGVAMAWRAGLPVRNMEFIQFHPTCLYHPEAKSFLVSEAVRGEGAELVNARGEAFMKRYDPRGSLAPRDIVARAIDHEMKISGDACVYLDVTHKTEEFLRGRFPNIYTTCLKYGIDMARAPVPVVPAAHYSCGGVEAGVDGHTKLKGLYVIGETSCTGLHGANRLASNSLLEAMVCGRKAADAICAAGIGASAVAGITIPDWQYGNAVPSDEAVVVEHNWNEVRQCMWDYVGIVRTTKRLERAARRIDNLQREIREYYLNYFVTRDVLELRNIAAVAGLIIRSAQRRKESRGLHYTLDYPNLDESRPPQDTVIADKPGGSIAII